MRAPSDVVAGARIETAPQPRLVGILLPLPELFHGEPIPDLVVRVGEVL